MAVYITVSEEQCNNRHQGDMRKAFWSVTPSMLNPYLTCLCASALRFLRANTALPPYLWTHQELKKDLLKQMNDSVEGIFHSVKNQSEARMKIRCALWSLTWYLHYSLIPLQSLIYFLLVLVPWQRCRSWQNAGCNGFKYVHNQMKHSISPLCYLIVQEGLGQLLRRVEKLEEGSQEEPVVKQLLERVASLESAAAKQHAQVRRM